MNTTETTWYEDYISFYNLLTDRRYGAACSHEFADYHARRNADARRRARREGRPS